MKIASLQQELQQNSYPGRGIVLGRSEDGAYAVSAYFIMGRSENSRNRVFVTDGDGIRQVLNRLSEAIKERTALLPNGDTMRISISGGIAWYPENGRDLATLKKYADFAGEDLCQEKCMRKMEKMLIETAEKFKK